MPATTKDHSNENQNNSSDNGSKSTTAATKAAAEQGLKCPRCDSPNTKFCYYNNYSLTQPRHFCKTCRRYWTKGGALRNVPIGGGCRKNKKGMKPPSSSSSSSSRALSYGDSRDSGGSSDILQLGGLTKLLNGLSNNPLDFNLGGLTTFPASSSSSRLQQFQLPIATGFYDYSNNNNSHNNQFCSFGDGSAASSSSGGFQLEPCSVVGGSSSSNLIGLNFPSAFPSASSSSSSSSGMFGSALQQGLNSLNFHTSTLASSIESLSSLNQDLHWKLQQQRLGMLYGGDNNQNQKENNNINNNVLFSAVNNNTNNNNNNVISTLENQGVVVQRPQPILFQSLEISKAVPSSSEIDTSTTTAPTEWFFGNNNSYGSAVAPTPITPTPTSTSSGGNNGGRSNNWVGVGGVHAWGDVQQPYTALP